MIKFTFKKQALKFLKKQSKHNQDRLITAIYKLPEGDIKPLLGHEPLQRLGVGNFRVIFDHQGTIINIVKIGNRGDVYK